MLINGDEDYNMDQLHQWEFNNQHEIEKGIIDDQKQPAAVDIYQNTPQRPKSNRLIVFLISDTVDSFKCDADFIIKCSLLSA